MDGNFYKLAFVRSRKNYRNNQTLWRDGMLGTDLVFIHTSGGTGSYGPVIWTNASNMTVSIANLTFKIFATLNQFRLHHVLHLSAFGKYSDRNLCKGLIYTFLCLFSLSRHFRKIGDICLNSQNHCLCARSNSLKTISKQRLNKWSSDTYMGGWDLQIKPIIYEVTSHPVRLLLLDHSLESQAVRL